MEIISEKLVVSAFRISTKDGGREAGHVYLYLMRNDLHEQPVAFVEDLWVEEFARGQGHGTSLMRELISEAWRLGCYKIIAISRHAKPEVHEMYYRLGFVNWGVELRIDLSP